MNVMVTVFPKRPTALPIVPGDAVWDVGTLALVRSKRRRRLKTSKWSKGVVSEMKTVQIQVHLGPM